MAWLCARGSAGLISGCASPSESGIAPFVTLSGTPTPRPYSWHGWKRRPWMRLLYGMTCTPLQASRGVEAWISSLQASRASRGPSRASAWVPKTRGGCGRKSLASSVMSSPRLSSSRTCPDSIDMASVQCFPTLPRSGLMLNGAVFQRAPLAHHTHAKGCSSWPTPLARDSRTIKGGLDLRRAPKAGRSLTDTIGRLMGWPDGRLNPLWVEWLMGLPPGWTDCAPLGLAVFQQWQRSHSAILQSVRG
jgi:hypothetical protein